MINIEHIEHKNQRYPTVGDWWISKETKNPNIQHLYIKVSKMVNADKNAPKDQIEASYEILIGVHELIEAVLCDNRKISEESITEFDIQFEKDREKGLHSPDEEPGDHPDAPYRKEHFFATSIERLLAAELGVNWKEYEKKIASL